MKELPWDGVPGNSWRKNHIAEANGPNSSHALLCYWYDPKLLGPMTTQAGTLMTGRQGAELDGESFGA